MATRHSLDVLLGEALSDLTEAVANAREIPGFDDAVVRRTIADVVVKIWTIREALYLAEPEIKPNFVKAFEADTPATNAVFAKLSAAVLAEQSGSRSEAERLYTELLNESRLDHIRVHAEAGLFRLTSTHGA